jgi:fido (protein-threonine AMPylation protein)
MAATISERSKKILRMLLGGEPRSRKAIEEATSESRITTIRELGTLVEQGLVRVSGGARATVYTITEAAEAVTLWDVEAYLAQEPDKRPARYKSLEPELFNKFNGVIGTPPVLIASAALKRRRTSDSVTARKDLERFVIELSWKSSKIEGNTYTLLDTERLIKESREAPGHDHAEAIMILNHKKAFEYIWAHQASFKLLTISAVEEVHQLLVTGLAVPYGMRDTPVGITGTVYVPPASKIELSGYMHDIIDLINQLHNPLEKTMACLMLFPYLQPFADGNKRTSRLVGNALLLAHGYPPLSYRSVDEQAYKGALILFYEQGSLANFCDLFIEQLKESALSYFFPTGDDGDTSQLAEE